MADDNACPVCGETGVNACINEAGELLNHDHIGRPPYFPPEFETIWPAR